MPLWLSDHAQDFLSKLLVKDPAKRSTAAQLLKHPWLKSLGFKPPVNQAPSSVEVVEPVLPSRPVVAAVVEAEAEAVVVTELAAAEEQSVEEETIKAVVPEEVAAPNAGEGNCNRADSIAHTMHVLHSVFANSPVTQFCCVSWCMS